MEEMITHEEFTKKLILALNQTGISYTLIGGVAAMFYGRPRTTQDCDVIISLDESQIKQLCESLRSHGFLINETDVHMAFKEKSHFNAYLNNFYLFRADFSWKNGSLADHTFKHAKTESIFGVRAQVTSPEDLIIAKLVYGSGQDFDDALAVLRRQKNLDKKYIQKRVGEEDVLDKWKELQKQAT